MADYEKAIELKPTLPSAFLGRGSARYLSGDLTGALADFEKAIQLKPDYADAYVNRGVLRGLQGDITGAIADIKKGAALNPRSISAEIHGRFSSTFGYLNSFISLNPTNARAFEMRAVIRFLQGNEAEAKSDFLRSKKLAPKLKGELERIAKELGRTGKLD